MEIKFTKTKIIGYAFLLGIILNSVFMLMNIKGILYLTNVVILLTIAIILFSSLIYYLDKENEIKTKIINCIIFLTIYLITFSIIYISYVIYFIANART